MIQGMNTETSRRNFLKSSAAAGAVLVVGCTPSGEITTAPDLIANPFVRITADSRVIVMIKHFEMGQGTTTGLATILAEELDADWDQIDTEYAPWDDEIYGRTGRPQSTGGSSSTRDSYPKYRRAGAAARDLMVRAAATKWEVDPGEVDVEKGIVRHTSGKMMSFGDLVGDAAALEPVQEPNLKDPAEFTLIGNRNLPRKDSPSKTDGSAVFAIDIKVDGMLYVMMARSPKFGGTVNGFDAGDALAVSGVVDVRDTGVGVAVYANSTWAAKKGRDALKIEWDFSNAETRSTDEIMAEHVAALDQPGILADSRGDFDAGFAGAVDTIEVDFEFPFLAHAPMEPMNCVLKFDGTHVELWDGCQGPGTAGPNLAKTLEIPPENVTIHTVLAGGSFGRRVNFDSDYVVEAALAAKAIGGSTPVKLVWTREDDLAGGYYRPIFTHRIRAGIDAEGTPIAWYNGIAGKGILSSSAFGSLDQHDGSSTEGSRNLPYTIPNFLCDLRNMETPVSILWWRSVGHTHTAFATEVAIDMLAEAAGADPVSYRMNLLADHPRHRGVLALAAEKAGWGEELPEGWGRGVAVHESFRSFVAQVVDVSTDENGAVKVERVVCAVDCGVAVNPDVIAAQMEGGIGYGLGAAMRNKITLTDGIVDQFNFPDYEPLRITDMPIVETHIVPSAEAPTGVGEPGLPPAAPALANAIYAATGVRVTKLPFVDHGVTFS